MLEVTQEALLHLLHTLQAQQVPDNLAMHLSAGGAEALELFPDQAQAGDRGFDIDSRTVLVVAKDLAESHSVESRSLSPRPDPGKHSCSWNRPDRVGDMRLARCAFVLLWPSDRDGGLNLRPPAIAACLVARTTPATWRRGDSRHQAELAATSRMLPFDGLSTRRRTGDQHGKH